MNDFSLMDKELARLYRLILTHDWYVTSCVIDHQYVHIDLEHKEYPDVQFIKISLSGVK